MDAPHAGMDLARWLEAHKGQEQSPGILREMLEWTVNAAMSAEADTLCGAGYRKRGEQRVNARNGYRVRKYSTPLGEITLKIPKLRKGTYFPTWLLVPGSRIDQALASVVASCYRAGISTRRMAKALAALGVRRSLSSSQVSRIAKGLDEFVNEFRSRKLNNGPYPFVALDAMVLKVREDGRTVRVHLLKATGINAHGQREVLGFDVTSAEDGAGWLQFVRSLVDNGLRGVSLVTSDAHAGLVAAIGTALPGAAWQRCRTHYIDNLLTRVPKSAHASVITLIRSIFDQETAEKVRQRFADVVGELGERFPKAADHLDSAQEDLLAFTAFPRAVWSKVWSNNQLERLNRETRRRCDVVNVFPNRASIIRLVGAVLAEQHAEWSRAARYIGPDAIARSLLRPVESVPAVARSVPHITDAPAPVRLTLTA